jgi:hypothetical protein
MPKLSFAPGSSINNLSQIQKLELNYTCQCIKNKVLNIKNAYVNPQETRSQRITRLSKQKAGLIRFGDGRYPFQTNVFGQIEGGPNGSGRPPSNRY